MTGDGEVRWQRPYGKPLQVDDREFSASYTGMHLQLVQNDDGPSLVAAANHSPYYPAEVALIDPLTGDTLDTYCADGSRRIERDFFGNPGPAELAYYVFPRADIDDVTGVPSKVMEVGVPEDGPLTLSVLSVNGKLTYSLDVEDYLQPKVIHVVPETMFRMSHDHVADQGLVDYRLGDTMPDVYLQVLAYETAPDGNSPEVAGAFRRQSE
jgi:hypothetical protein